MSALALNGLADQQKECVCLRKQSPFQLALKLKLKQMISNDCSYVRGHMWQQSASVDLSIVSDFSESHCVYNKCSD